MTPPTRHLGFYRATGVVVICAVVFALTYPLLERLINH